MSEAAALVHGPDERLSLLVWERAVDTAIWLLHGWSGLAVGRP